MLVSDIGYSRERWENCESQMTTATPINTLSEGLLCIYLFSFAHVFMNFKFANCSTSRLFHSHSSRCIVSGSWAAGCNLYGGAGHSVKNEHLWSTCMWGVTWWGTSLVICLSQLTNFLDFRQLFESCASKCFYVMCIGIQVCRRQFCESAFN